MASTLIGKQAMVIGAGMAGLTAAGALADRFDQVVVLERDTLPSEPAYRAGTPQARHVHALLLSGQRALSELFPGFEQDLAQAGAVPLRAGLDVRIERQGYHPFPQRDLGWISYAVSRPTIERAVRARVEGRANTTLRQRCRVQEVLASPDGKAVTGVRYDNEDGASETIAADLVVDASGRGALTIALLQSIGRPLPEETTIGIDLGYATCVFAIPDDAPADWKGVMTFGQAPDDSRGGLMLPLEGNRWMATIGGRHGDVPSGDAEGFLTYARALRTPTIYNAISRARRLDGVARYGLPGERAAAFRATRGLPPRASADRRRHLPLQSGLRPGHERGRPGSVPAPGASRATGGRQRPDRRAGADLLRRGADVDRDAMVGRDTRLRVSRYKGAASGGF
jgi:2-polyprenyl-6-methoxyphenol hydroxylase-like FAD-dependent oxidoreductase